MSNTNANAEAGGKLVQNNHEYKGLYKPMYKALDALWNRMPNYVSTCVATILLVMAGSVMRGDWLFLGVHFFKNVPTNESVTSEIMQSIPSPLQHTNVWSLKYWKLENLGHFLVIDLIFSYSFYYVFCGFLQWYFYIRQRSKPEAWKCQPQKFLSPEVERHEILLGSLNVGVGCLFFGTLACYVNNGGTSTIYFKPDEYGWIWFLVCIPLHFLYQDAGAYYCHRLLHTPFLYRHFHKWHHYYKQPTAFSTTAMHPAELLFFQMFMIFPAFLIPIHAITYVGTLIYIYYYGIMTHSGVDMKSFWPWQPTVRFHDNHHQYFHVNFGFNTTLFDRIHGTMRKKDRVYNENIFYGKGIALEEATKDQKVEHASEMAAENKNKYF